ncbi:MAG: MMPL family transporter, partial [Polyangiaceae bacterium]|nr:MMPL family transporter [Polyangiaceae bacterium]
WGFCRRSLETRWVTVTAPLLPPAKPSAIMWRQYQPITESTTAVSLAALAAPSGPALLRAVGAWGALGTAIAYALTFTLGGPLLRLLPDQRPVPAWPSALGRRAVIWSARRARWLVGGWLAVMLIAACALPRLRVESRYPRVFADGQGGAFEADLAALPAALGADLLPLEVHLVARTERARQARPLLLAAIGLHDYLSTLPETRLSLSAATLVHEWAAREPRAASILASLERGRSEGGALLRDVRVAHWLQPTRGRARAQVLFARTSYADKGRLLRFIEHYVASVHQDYEVRFAGPFFVYYAAEREGIHGIVQGAALDVLLLVLTFALVFRRAFSTACAVVVNVAPVLVTLGVMALAGVPWSLGLLGLPVVIFGLTVDDTIHLLWEARGASGRRLYMRFSTATRRSAGAVLATTALLSGCLAAFARSGFQVNRELGALLPLGLGAGLLAEFTLLPALLALGVRAARRKSARSWR